MCSNKKLLWRSTFIVFIFFVFIVFFLFWLWSLDFFSEHKWAFILGAGALSLFLVYVMMSFVLDPLFKTNTLLDELLKNTLHELNIPLSTIKANTQLLKKDMDERSKKRIERIEKASQNLQKLYGEVDYYIKREMRLVEREEFEVKRMILELLEQVSFLDRSIKVTLKMQDYWIKADKIGFEKTLLNLLTNAYKYNKKNGTILVELNEHKLSISDSGVGMSEETKFHLFDRYYQQNSSSTGYGIGLSIVKDFCDRHGVFISITSWENMGTKISLHVKPLYVDKINH